METYRKKNCWTVCVCAFWRLWRQHVCFLCSLKGPNANEHEKRDERYLSRVAYGGEMRKKSCYVAKTEVLRGTGLINHPHVSHVQNIMQRTASHCCEINHSSLTQEPEDSDLQRKLIFCVRLLMMMNSGLNHSLNILLLKMKFIIKTETVSA